MRHPRLATTARATRRRGERGAILSELLLVVPLLLFCALAAVEIGSAYRSRLTVSGALRTTTRVVANAGNDGSADWQAVSALRSSLGGISFANVDRVVIYKAGANGDPLDPSCLTAAVVASRGVAGRCTVYTSAVITTATAADFTASGAANCLGRFDAQWCPVSRLAEFDSVGVWVSIRHQYASKFLPSSVTLTDRIVMRIEPDLS